MTKKNAQIQAIRTPPLLDLFPAITPYSSGFLSVDTTHNLYWEQSGNPDGAPVILLHGGPGAGATPTHRRFFNPREAGRSDVTETAMIQTLKQSIAGFKVPRQVYFVDALPRNSMGKVQKTVLRERYRT